MSLGIRGALPAACATAIGLAGCLTPEEPPPPSKAPSACAARSGRWAMTSLTCDGARVGLSRAGIQSFEVTFPSETTARTTVQFASGCRLAAESSISSSGGAWSTTFLGESCEGGCSNAECDGAVPSGTESWTCESSAFENSITLRSEGASICRGARTEELWVRQ